MTTQARSRRFSRADVRQADGDTRGGRTAPLVPRRDAVSPRTRWNGGRQRDERGRGESGAPHPHCLGTASQCGRSGKRRRGGASNQTKTQLPPGPATPLLGVHPKDAEWYLTEVSAPRVHVSMAHTSQAWKRPECPPGDEGRKKLGWKPTRGTSQPSGEGEAAIRRPRMKPEVTVTRATSGRGERASTRDGVSAWEAENDLETAGDPAHRGSRLCARRAAGPLGGDRAVPHQ